jgi:hypothetical protein
MIGWLLKKVSSTNQTAPRPEGTKRSAPQPDCAVWNDIRRALDSKPRGTR